MWLIYLLTLLEATVTLCQTTALCSKVIFTVEVSSNNSVFGNSPAENDSRQLVNSVDEYLTGNSSFGPVGNAAASGTFEIAATYCRPVSTSGGNENTLQFLVHGATYNSSIWSGFDMSSQYSWVDYAVDRGFSTLAIDRVGHGASSHPDPVTVAQFELNVSVLHQVISQIRAGPSRNPLQKTFGRVIYVGHSYGSFLGNAVAREYPNDFDAMILSGYSVNIKFPVPILLNKFDSAVNTAGGAEINRHLPLGYLRATNETGRGVAFYGQPGSFDPNILAFDFASADTVTVGELLTQAGGFVAAGYKGPVLIVTGDSDVIFCNEVFGTCKSTLLSTQSLFPNSTQFDVYVAENAGHCLTLHYSAPDIFKTALDWVDANSVKVLPMP